MFKSFAHFAGLSAGSRLRLLLSEFFSWFPKPSRGRLLLAFPLRSFLVCIYTVFKEHPLPRSHRVA